jgi:hypothetical protein
MKALAAFAFALVCALHEPVASACVAVSAPGSYVRLEAEKTLIVWDERAGVEHFVRKPVFEGDPRSFGFLVPTPEKPEVGKESDDVFARLEELVPIPAPATHDAHVPRAAVAAAAAVEVEQRVQIDDFELVTLRASDAGALVDWLGKNGFADRPEIAAWAQKYVARAWVFNAMRYAPKNPDARTQVATPTVRLSFAIATPFYPYTEAPPSPVEEQAFVARTHTPLAPRPLDLWVVARDEVEARAGGAAAGPQKVARASVSPEGLARALGPTGGWRFDPKSQGAWTVTRFHESVVRRTAFDDLVFAGAASTEDEEGGAPNRALLVVVSAAALLGIAIALATDRSSRER